MVKLRLRQKGQKAPVQLRAGLQVQLGYGLQKGRLPAPRAHQQMLWLRLLGKDVQPIGQQGWLIGKQANQLGVCSGFDALRCQPNVFVKSGLALGQIGFAQQATCRGRKAWIEKMLGPAAAIGRKSWRRQQVHALHIILGAQMLHIQPKRALVRRQG